MEGRAAFRFVDNKVIILLRDRVCETPEELISSKLFLKVLDRFVNDLKEKCSPLLHVFGKDVDGITESDVHELVEVFQVLHKMGIDAVPKLVENGGRYIADPSGLLAFCESLYNYWRQLERFIICDSTGDRLDKRPYRTFNSTIESLTHLVRQTYRDIEENITGQHPAVFRQVSAGAEVAVIALPKELALPRGSYQKLRKIPLIRQLLLIS